MMKNETFFDILFEIKGIGRMVYLISKNIVPDFEDQYNTLRDAEIKVEKELLKLKKEKNND